MTTVEAHSCLLNMHMTFDLAEIKELMPHQARKQLEAELGTSFCSLGGIYCLYTAVLVSPVQSPGFTETLMSWMHNVIDV